MRYWPSYLARASLVLIDIVSDLAFAWFTMQLIDSAVAGDVAGVRFALGVGVALLLIGAVNNYLAQHLGVLTTDRVRRDLRRDLFDRILRLPTGFFAKTHSGDLVSRITNDVNGIRGAIGWNLIGMVQHPLAALGAFIFMLQIHAPLALLCVIVAPSTALLGKLFGAAMRRNSERLHELLARCNAFLHDAFAGHVIVRAFVLERRLHARYESLNEEQYGLEFKAARLNGGLSAAAHVVGMLAFFTAIGAGGYLVAADQLSVGSVMAFVQLLGRLTWPFTHFAHSWAQLQSSLAAADRLFKVLDEPVALETLPVPKAPGPLKAGLSFHNVDFAYEEGVKVLEGFDLDVPAGKVTAIVGPSGAGKSTLFNLVLGLYRPQSGEIRLDGQLLWEMEPADLRSRISIVPQETYLFAGTVRENIAYGLPDSGEEAIRRAAAAANAHDFIMRLPNGYDTEIGERGVRLSGGQRQRVAIARALLKDAPLLLLDEATSALDTESEYAVQEALSRLMKGRTTLVIAHRLSTVHHADRIVVLDRGRIVESGNHLELIERGGLYARLYEMQFLRREAETA